MKPFIVRNLRYLLITFQSTLLALTFALGAPAASAQVSPDTWYVLVNRHSGLAMDIASNSTEDGAMLTQWNRTDADNQQFQFIDAGNGYYRVVARHSGKALDVFEWNADNGADIVQWEDVGGTNQQFRLDDMGGGYYRLVNNFSEKALDNWDWSTEPGTRISQYTPTDAAVQQWEIIEVDGSGGSDPDPDQCGSGAPDATVTGAPGDYQVNGSDAGSNYLNAINSAINSLSSGRTSRERVTVYADGSIGGNRIDLPSHTAFEVCGTMDVGNSGGNGAVQAIGVQDVSVPYLNMTGTPYFGMRFADVHDLHLGQIDLRLGSGIGIRFERDMPGSTNVRMDDIYVSGTGNHGVETWNVDGLEIGTVIARNTAYAGLLLNNTRNATIGLIDGEGTGSGTGYATLRFANENGRIGGSYPTNIYVDRVISRGGGRGFFCVSNSGGAQINEIDLANNGNNSVLIENCHNIQINGGEINGGGEFRLAARSEFPNNSDITISNLNVFDTSVRESPCGNNISWNNVNVQNGSYNICN
ncbi:RICIN domain-containing protein [Marinimicrobium sp. C2-29]|uniref:RICIN domain-containing protein n=1 Tax=Marinimicrobium sp. C2-29 TaxID=3139825 RepID=UPI003139F378